MIIREYNDLDEIDPLHTGLLDPDFDQFDGELTEWSAYLFDNEQKRR